MAKVSRKKNNKRKRRLTVIAMLKGTNGLYCLLILPRDAKFLLIMVVAFGTIAQHKHHHHY